MLDWTAPSQPVPDGGTDGAPPASADARPSRDVTLARDSGRDAAEAAVDQAASDLRDTAQASEAPAALDGGGADLGVDARDAMVWPDGPDLGLGRDGGDAQAGLPDASEAGSGRDAAGPPLLLATPSLPDATVGGRYSFTLSATGGTPPLVWSIDSGQLPTGITLAPSTGTLSGTPTAAGTASLAVKVTDASTPSQSQIKGLTLTVGGATALGIVTTTLPNGTTGQAYAQPANASGGEAPYRWAVVSGALPAGMALDAGTGLIHGTPTAAGTATFVLQATDSSAPVESASRTLSIVVENPLSVVTAPLPSGVVGTPYASEVTASGGSQPYQWTVTSGALPGGLTLSPSTGTISGIPLGAGSATFGLTVKDSSNPAQFAGVSLTVVIAAPLSIATSSLPDGEAGVAYASTITASGGQAPLTWTVSSGALPPGLALDPASGLLYGTPTAGSAGLYTFSVAVSDSAAPMQRASSSFTLRILAPVSIATAALPDATVGASYTTSLQATGGIGPYQWSLAAGALPSGLGLSQAGVLQGTPGTAGSYTVTVSVTDAASPPGRAQRQLTLTVVSTLAVKTTTLPTGTVGQAYAAQVTVTGGVAPYQWQVKNGPLPSGLTLDASTGRISGTPTQAGSATFTVAVTDATNAQASASLTLDVVAPPLTILTTTLPVATRGMTYSATLQTSGGTPPYTWSLTSGTLPRSLILQPRTGVISGSVSTRDTPGTTAITVQVVDSGTPAQQQTAQLALTVQ